jgi:hypothetical protein
MSAIKCMLLIAIMITIIIAIVNYNSEGFRSPEKKSMLATMLVDKGQPMYETFKKNGLDGVEYYDAKQLWNKQDYTLHSLESIL